MGLLVDGQWRNDGYGTEKTRGRFVRKDSHFRDWVRADGSTRFAPDADRYHLYVSLACPWAHRTLIYRKLKGLDDAISVSVVEPLMGIDGWSFGDAPDSIPDSVNHTRFLRDVYLKADSHYTGRVTVPVLWDRKLETVVSNESAEIIRMFDREFAGVADGEVELCPRELEPEIDAVNAFIYPTINNGVYRCGFATSQEAYEEAYRQLFFALDTVDERLSRQRYLVSGQISEADWRLFTTLVRFDAVYVGHFKCNRNRIDDFPNLSGYLRELYQVPGVRETVHFAHIKDHYYRSHTTINPTGVVPAGPLLDLDAPHGRESLPTQV
jgi:putative glutathione S-transferase